MTSKEKEERGEYLGRVSEHELVGKYGSRMTGTSLIFIKRNLYKMQNPANLTLSPIPKYPKVQTLGGWHGSDVNTNLVVGFTKKQLMEITNSMQDGDIFNVAHLPNGYKYPIEGEPNG